MNCPVTFVVMTLNLYSVENWYILVRLRGKRKLKKKSRLFTGFGKGMAGTLDFLLGLSSRHFLSRRVLSMLHCFNCFATAPLFVFRVTSCFLRFFFSICTFKISTYHGFLRIYVFSPCEVLRRYFNISFNDGRR